MGGFLVIHFNWNFKHQSVISVRYCILICILIATGYSAPLRELTLYISADTSGTKESGIAISQGINVALSEINNTIKGVRLKVKFLDHRGSTPRARKHLKIFLNDTNALALFSGLHSPPLLATKDFINKNKILVLDPWAAAGPITRSNTDENWIFRLSIDDRKAGDFIAQHAVKKDHFAKPYLVLEETGWGKSNKKTMIQSLATMGIIPAGISWFNWNLGINQAKLILRNAYISRADVIFFVGNSPEGKKFAQGMFDLPKKKQLPIRSHWGITGGDFSKTIPHTIRKEIDIKFIQTSFSFFDVPTTSIASKAFTELSTLYPTIKSPKDLEAPTGFIHAYDLTKIVITALREIPLSGTTVQLRNRLRTKLEHMTTPVHGLIKTYRSPFNPWHKSKPDSHEALSSKDYRMGYFGPENEIRLLK